MTPRPAVLTYRYVAIALAAVAVIGLTIAIGTATGPPPVEPDAGGVTAEVDAGGQRLLTHGDDVLPPKPPQAVPAMLREAPWPCVGDGQDGPRVQMIYAHAAGVGSLEAKRATLESYARRVQANFTDSAPAGMTRLVRYVTATDCSLSILDVTLSANGVASWGAMVNEFAALGLNRPDRKYHAWVEANVFCGMGSVTGDDRPGPANQANGGPSYARTDQNCSGGETETHEILHNLGAVQLSAPNSTGGWHCKDSYDVMCYADGAPSQDQTVRCSLLSDRYLLDCRDDDYFSLTPAAGGYLESHWNVASSAYLEAGTPPTTTPPPPTTVPPTTVPPPTTTTTAGPNNTTTELVVGGERTRVGEAAVTTATVTGCPSPSGVVAFYVSGKLMERVVLVDGQATLTLRFAKAGRFAVRADYSGSSTCASSSDSVRKRIYP